MHTFITTSNLTPNLAIVLGILLLSGCASSKPFHDLPVDSANCLGEGGEEYSRCVYQKYPDYDIAFAEYTDRGNAFNDEWINGVLEEIGRYANDPGVVVVTFIHGWKHNAEESDENLLQFKASLAKVAGDRNSPIGDKRLIGLYIGWPGATLQLPIIENVTFWDRKAVAEEVGKGGVTKILLELDRIDRKTDDNVLVIVGHSFGGAIVVSALSEVLNERIIGDTNHVGRCAANGSTNGIGDAVIVLNPAIEANQVLTLVEAAIRHSYDGPQNPLFISVSSDADQATHRTFPLGQTVGLLLTWHQTDLQRSYYSDRLTGELLTLKEEQLDATTVGNFAPYLTHRLDAEDTSATTKKLTLQTCNDVPESCVPMGLTTLSGHPTIRPLPENYPLYFIKTDESVMKGHNDIFNPVLRAFMLSLIDDTVTRTVNACGNLKPEIALSDDEAPKKVSASILTHPNALNTRFQYYYAPD